MNDNMTVIGDTPQSRLAIGWLYVAVGFLLASGIYPLLLALARTTYEMPWKDFFYTALVLHVDFTVLWWLLAIAAVFWTLNASIRGISYGWLALALVVIGGIVAGIAPLTGAANPLTNNYVPMLENRMFIKGLVLFGGGIMLLLLRSLVAMPYRQLGENSFPALVNAGAIAAAIAAMAALLLLLWSLVDMPLSHGRSYYEALFWSGGHTLQFVHTSLLCVAWIWLARVCGVHVPGSPRMLAAFIFLGVVPVFLLPWPVLSYEVGSPEFMRWFVGFMRDGNGIAPVLIGLPLVWGLLRSPMAGKEQRHLYAALVFSLILFAVGGVLGWLVTQSSTLITAHYHGVIVSVTMAYMAMTYHWLPRFGFARPNLKWAKVQVSAYAVGQMIHVIGLAWGGGHGMKRKVVGTAQDIGVHAWITPQDLVGIGGVIAVLSGVLFAAVVLPVMLKGRIRTTESDAKA